jgi:spore coat protein U-like protein
MGKSLNYTLPKTAFVNRKEKSMKTKLNQSKLKLAIVSAMLLGTAGITAPAYAVDKTADLNVSANIGNSCTITATDLTFGAYDPIVTNKTDSLDKMAAVSSTCTTGATGSIALGNGGNFTEGDGRRMVHETNAAKFLNYNVSNASYGGASWIAAVTVAFTGTGSPDAKDVYGSVAPAQSTAINGNYSDTIVATISY